MGMYKWIQTVSLRSYAIACHLKLRDRFDRKVITELKEEISKLKGMHAKEI